MTTAAWITLATALLTLFLHVKTRIKMDAVFIMCMAILLFTGVLSEEQTFRGFVSRGALVIVFLGFVVAAMANTGALHWLSRQLLGKYVSMPRSLLRVTSLTALLSGFIPNVALGNIMYGSVNEWTHKNHIASSRLLLPVAYAVSFGSAMTVIGNSSNLIWSEMYTSITGNDMPFFAPLAACLACMVAGLVAIQLFRDRLTDHLNSEELADTFRDYCVELIVPSDSPLWGKTLSEAGIFAGEDFYLVKIQAFDNEVKEEDHIHPDIQVMGGDRLVFAGKLDAIRRIQQKWKLVVENDLNSKSSVLKKLTTHYQVAAIAPKSYLIGCRLSETQFEQRYSVTGIAICRNGVFLGESIREVELQEGDMMVLHGAKLPWHRLTNVVISQTSSDVYSYDWHTIASSLILLAIILTSVFNLMPLMRAAFLGAIVTSLEFEEYDQPYSGEKLCDPEKCGAVCVQVCPVHALEAGEGIEWRSGEAKVRVGKLDVNGCSAACFDFADFDICLVLLILHGHDAVFGVFAGDKFAFLHFEGDFFSLLIAQRSLTLR